ncbi:MAG: carboxypeptidase-like regulatory domain-containing protein [Gemmatimonadota bacterium]
MRGHLALVGLALMGSLVPRVSYSQDSQMVRGTVLDDATGEPVPAAQIVLRQSRGGAVGTAFADSLGTFEFQVAEPGDYFLRVSRIGYPATDSPPFDLRPSETIEVTFRISAEAVLLAPLSVDFRSRSRLGRDEFANRCAQYDGTCFDPVHIALLEPIETTDVFRTVPGLIVVPGDPMRGIMGGPTQVHRIGSGCLAIFLDFNPIPIAFSRGRTLMTPGVQGFGSAGGVRTIMDGLSLDMALPVRAVRAIEVYRDYDELPQDLLDGPRG